jgi:hypothetical protein
MKTMIDEIFDREYQAGRADLNAGLDRLVSRLASAFGDTFDSMKRVQFNAPWARKDVHRA